MKLATAVSLFTASAAATAAFITVVKAKNITGKDSSDATINLRMLYEQVEAAHDEIAHLKSLIKLNDDQHTAKISALEAQVTSMKSNTKATRYVRRRTEEEQNMRRMQRPTVQSDNTNQPPTNNIAAQVESLEERVNSLERCVAFTNHTNLFGGAATHITMCEVGGNGISYVTVNAGQDIVLDSMNKVTINSTNVEISASAYMVDAEDLIDIEGGDDIEISSNTTSETGSIQFKKVSKAAKIGVTADTYTANANSINMDSEGFMNLGAGNDIDLTANKDNNTLGGVNIEGDDIALSAKNEIDNAAAAYTVDAEDLIDIEGGDDVRIDANSTSKTGSIQFKKKVGKSAKIGITADTYTANAEDINMDSEGFMDLRAENDIDLTANKDNNTLGGVIIEGDDIALSAKNEIDNVAADYTVDAEDVIDIEGGDDVRIDANATSETGSIRFKKAGKAAKVGVTAGTSVSVNANTIDMDSEGDMNLGAAYDIDLTANKNNNTVGGVNIEGDDIALSAKNKIDNVAADYTVDAEDLIDIEGGDDVRIDANSTSETGSIRFKKAGKAAKVGVTAGTSVSVNANTIDMDSEGDMNLGAAYDIDLTANKNNNTVGGVNIEGDDIALSAKNKIDNVAADYTVDAEDLIDIEGGDDVRIDANSTSETGSIRFKKAGKAAKVGVTAGTSVSVNANTIDMDSEGDMNLGAAYDIDLTANKNNNTVGGVNIEGDDIALSAKNKIDNVAAAYTVDAEDLIDIEGGDDVRIDANSTSKTGSIRFKKKAGKAAKVGVTADTFTANANTLIDMDSERDMNLGAGSDINLIADANGDGTGEVFAAGAEKGYGIVDRTAPAPTP